MASNNRQQAQHERKQDRTHVSEGQRRANQAAEQRRRQAQAERERVERANEEMRAKRRDRPDILDTSYQIEVAGGVRGSAEDAGDVAMGNYIPFSFVDREGDEPTEETNAARARGVRGGITPHGTPVLIGEGGVPVMRENLLERIDPSSRVQRRALQMFAQKAREDRKLARRWDALRIAMRQGEVAGRTRPSIATLNVIGRQMRVSRSSAANYLRDARAYMQGCLDMAAEYERERA